MKISETIKTADSSTSVKSSGLDRIDLAILDMLGENPRATYAELAARVKLSRDGVKYRIARMEKNGIIKGYCLSLDFKRLGLGNRCMVNVAFASPDDPLRQRFGEHLRKLPSVEDSFKTLGNWDFSVLLVSRDNEHLNEILTGIRSVFQDQIREIRVVPVVE